MNYFVLLFVLGLMPMSFAQNSYMDKLADKKTTDSAVEKGQKNDKANALMESLERNKNNEPTTSSSGDYVSPIKKLGPNPSSFKRVPRVSRIEFRRKLSPEDQSILMNGRIGPASWVTGPLASYLIGFGSGQAIQGRFNSDGLKFAVMDGVSVAVVLFTSVQCLESLGNCDGSLGTITLAATVLAISRLWQLGDSVFSPIYYNKRFDYLKRLEEDSVAIVPYLDSSKEIIGLNFKARF
ncbi:MAG: hypothetical protein AB8E15_12290 [Bdellovibrionales bacterium]